MANGKQEISEDVKEKIEEYRFDLALAKIWERVRGADKIISENKIWTLENTAKQPFLDDLVSVIRQIGVDLAPFMPVTASKITKCYQGEKILKENLFPRLGI